MGRYTQCMVKEETTQTRRAEMVDERVAQILLEEKLVDVIQKWQRDDPFSGAADFEWTLRGPKFRDEVAANTQLVEALDMFGSWDSRRRLSFIRDALRS